MRDDEVGEMGRLLQRPEDADYWAKCTNVSSPHAVSDPWDGVTAANDNRRWMMVPSSNARWELA